MAVSWDVARCGLVDTDRRFRGAYCLHYQGDDHHTTKCYIAEDSHLYTRRRDNLQIHQSILNLFHVSMNFITLQELHRPLKWKAIGSMTFIYCLFNYTVDSTDYMASEGNGVTQLRFQILTAESTKMTVFWDVPPCSLHHQGAIIAASTSEMSVNSQQTTRRNIPEDSHLQQ
jgi:hypothetical protein